MTGVKKSTDAGLSNAERKDLRGREAKEAAARPMFYPAPELPDDTPIENVRFSTRVRNALTTAGLKTVGEIREASDAMLLSLQDLGKGSVAHLRETLGLPSMDGVRPKAGSR
jgi:DNA-directed RNA polymerase alpha subunit